MTGNYGKINFSGNVTLLRENEKYLENFHCPNLVFWEFPRYFFFSREIVSAICYSANYGKFSGENIFSEKFFTSLNLARNIKNPDKSKI